MKKVLCIITTGFAIGGGLTAVMMNYYRALWNNEKYDGKYKIDFCSQNAIDNRLSMEIKAHGCKYYQLPSRKKHTIGHYAALRKIVKNGNYNIVHLNCNSATGAFDLMTIGKYAPKRIAHIHNSNTQYPFIHKVMKSNFNRLYTDAVACSQLAGDWIFTRPFTVLNNAVDVDKFQYSESKRKEMKKQFGLTDGDYVIGHVGKMFSDQKNQEYLISILPAIKKKIPEAKLFFVGDGQYMETHKKEAKESGHEMDIIFAGFHSNTYDYMQLFDVFCFPSRYEGLGMVAVEAQASGLCVVMSDLIPREAAVTSNTTFVGITKEAENDWVDAIMKYKNDGMPRTGRCAKAKEEIGISGYDINKELDKLINIYEQ